MLTRINSLEKNINYLMELKNIAQELHEAYTSFNSRIKQAEGRMSEISEMEDYLAEIRQADEIRQKKNKKEQTKPPRNMGLCKKIYWSTWKEMRIMKPSWKIHFRILSRRTSPA